MTEFYDLLVQLRRCSEGRCRGCQRSHAEGCRSTVSTEAAVAIEELQKDLERSKDFEAFWQKEAEEALRKFQVAIAQKPQWIPVTESYPETNDEVLVTYIVNGNRSKRYVEAASWYDGDEGFWTSAWDEYRVPGTRMEIIAWMPFPKPYEPPKEGE